MPSSVLRLHPSWISFFLMNHSGGNVHVSLSKFFLRWRRLYYFLFNIYFFNLGIIYFGNIFFKNDINSLNWSVLGRTESLFRYAHNFFTLKPSRIFNQGWVLFYKLRLSGLNLAFVCDLRFHKKTLYYLRRVQFFTIGIVPINYNQLLLDFALPSSSDNYTTQLFMLHFTRSLKKTAELHKYHSRSKLWKDFYQNL